jgi:DNA-binding MurR/RpiR family transcriptional regulator
MHRPALSILIRIRGAVPNLRPAEQRVAQAVLANPAKVSESSITSVARQCQTSETTVLRFCRAIGLAGYPELRIALARAAQYEEAGQAKAPLTGDINATDTLEDVVSKITHSDTRAVEDTAAALDVAVLKDAVDAVITAPRIDIYGAAASALVAQDLHQKLHRIGKVSFMWSDPHMALTSAAMLQSGDVAIGISHTGTTNDAIDVLREAHGRGATTLVITNFAGSPITDEADLTLLTAARETTFRSGAMASRIAQLMVIDCLFAGVAQRSFEQSLQSLDSTFAVVRSRHSQRGRR